jgi:hypothetical protein
MIGAANAEEVKQFLWTWRHRRPMVRIFFLSKTE